MSCIGSIDDSGNALFVTYGWYGMNPSLCYATIQSLFLDQEFRKYQALTDILGLYFEKFFLNRVAECEEAPRKKFSKHV